jgi:hypothetical protein
MQKNLSNNNTSNTSTLFIEEVYLCRFELYRLHLTWTSPRTLAWIEKRGQQINKPYISAHDLDQSDFKALYRSLTQIH